MGPQTPSVPPPFFATVHAWQSPPQAVLQQTPSTQLPEAHCPLIVQAPPFTMGVTHWPIAQTKPLAQSTFVVQAPWQAPPEQA